jgi:gluconate:H+ symporter, GntP family
MPHLAATAAQTEAIHWWPLGVLAISLAAVVLMITRFRVHAFFALIAAAMLTGLLADKKLPGEFGTLPATPAKEKSHHVRAIELTVEGFGGMAAKIGVVVALAAVIGVCLVESGAADKVVRRFLALLGEKRAGHALFGSGYVLSIPIFFETYFMLLMPLAQALHLRTRRNYMLYVLAICCGGTITHSLVAPHPGPLAMAENLHLDIGQTIIAGILAGLLPATFAWWLAQKIARRVNAPMRDTAGASRAELDAIIARPESELPSLGASLLPILLPLVLIGSVSVLQMLGGRAAFPAFFPWIEFFGERHVALMLGAVGAMSLLMRQRGITMARVTELIGPQFAIAGVIILVASAGGAFGKMLEHAGVGDVVKASAAKWSINLVFLAWAVSALIRVAQGSATVAMTTASAIMWPLISAGGLPYHPMYIFLAIGFGSKMISWMNDGGFWTVSKVSGFTESETLRSWTILVTAGSLAGLAQCLVLSRILPFAQQ